MEMVSAIKIAVSKAYAKIKPLLTVNHAYKNGEARAPKRPAAP